MLQPQNLKKFLKLLKMNEIVLQPSKPVKESNWTIFQWTSSTSFRAFKAESELLSHSLSLEIDKRDERKPDGFLSLVGLKSGDWINTLSLQQKLDPNKKNLVIAHGYGAGLGFFYKNYASLARVRGYNVFSVDWLGMANSSRPKYPKRHRKMTDDQIVQQSEDFFIDSLDEWREKMGIEKMVLAGHSLGGYLSTAYSEKYPDRVEKLILVSPAGVPLPPSPEAAPRRSGYLWKFISNLWSWNFTPQTFIRTLGPAGPRLVRSYATRRFAHLDQSEIDALDSYIYHISALRGSGEFALARLLLPGAIARKPLHDRLPKLKMPVTFMYGDEDWMDHRHGLKAAALLHHPSKVAVVQNAGHHLYLDNPEAFDHALACELDGGKLSGRPDVSYPVVG